ncbi:MAG: prepilin peptidase [Actinobacteria bacterium]|nr:prepilin peptidase [Actinomycetota bacterium]
MDLQIILISAAFFLSGLIIGSFLNILIYKLPRKISLFKPYSVCFWCRKPAPLIYSFPIMSLIIGKTRCKNCSRIISFQSIFVELLNGFLYVLVYLTFSLSFYSFAGILNIFSGIIFVSVVIVVSFIDWEFMIIPNIIVLPFTLAGLILSLTRILLVNPSAWWTPFVFSAGAFIFMLIIHIIYPRGMGMGDVKLSLMLGAFLVKNVIVGLFMGFLIGSIAGIIFMIFKKKTLKQFIPFGPFLSAGGLLALFFGDAISGWYTGFF